MNNWLYDLTAPELGHRAPNDIPVQGNQGGQTDDEFDEMEQDAPTFFDPTTHEHTAPDPSDAFAGTSPRHQSREEYDYVDIRTALDDVLCKLRYCNDANAERNQLLRNIQRHQVDMMAQIQQIQDQQHDYILRTEHNITGLIEEMEGMHVGTEDLLEYMQHVGIPPS